MIMSRSGLDFLERQRIFIPRRHRPRHQKWAAKSHTRAVRPLPDLVGPDEVEDRVKTQAEEDREAYTDGNCDACRDIGPV
jgi:hypothetical protein